MSLRIRLKKDNQGNYGYTILEALLSLAIGGIIIAALALFFGRGVSINRQSYEQILITEDARIQLTRITDTLRNAVRNSTANDWLISAADNSLTLYTPNADGSSVDKVTFSLSGTDFTKTVERKKGNPDNQGNQFGVQEPVTLSRNVRNIALQKPVFVYYGGDDKPLVTAGATSDTVKKISVTLLVDVNPNQDPKAVEVSTFVRPRSTVAVNTTSSRLWAVTIRYPASPSTNPLAEVDTTNPTTGTVGRVAWPITYINNGNLNTYNGYPVNINYQATTQGSFVPGWYAWIGPIKVGESPGQSYFKTDQVPVGSLCFGAQLSTMLGSCPNRTVSTDGFSVQYQPIIMYSSFGNIDFVSGLTFDY